MRVSAGTYVCAQNEGSAAVVLYLQVCLKRVDTQNTVSRPPHQHGPTGHVQRRLWRDNRIKTRFGERNYFKEVSTQKRFYFQYSSEFKVQSVKRDLARLYTSPVLRMGFGHA